MSKKNILSLSKTTELIRLLGKVKLPTTYPIFIALCKSVPMVAVNLALFDQKGRILLIYRTDEFYDNWHIPGSILRYNETPHDAISRVRTEELAYVKIKKPKFVTYFVEHDSRGHELVLLFVARIINKPKKGEFFKLDAMPKRFLRIQQKEINTLKCLINMAS